MFRYSTYKKVDSFQVLHRRAVLDLDPLKATKGNNARRIHGTTIDYSTRQQYLVLATKKWRARHHPKARRAVIKCPLLNTEIEEEVIHLTNITTQMVVGPQSTKCQSLPQTHTWPTMVTKMETHVLDLCLPMATKCLVFLQKKKTKSWIEDIGGQRQNLFSVV